MDAAIPRTALPARLLPRALRRFLHTEASGAIVLLVAAVVALVWANSPRRQSYADLWHTELVIRFGPVRVAEDLRQWVDEALMALFFFVVGLEIKRELVAGELRNWRTAALPVFAAVGGMAVPALVYSAVTLGGGGVRGWGIPMATDIAFALGVAALLGPRVPASLKLFLLTLAIVDDIGAIVVIAVFYSSSIEWVGLAVAAVLVGAVVVLRRRRVRSDIPYVILGIGVWVAVFRSGVHATLAGVVLGLLTPATPLAPEGVARRWAEDLAEEPNPAEPTTSPSTTPRATRPAPGAPSASVSSATPALARASSVGWWRPRG